MAMRPASSRLSSRITAVRRTFNFMGSSPAFLDAQLPTLYASSDNLSICSWDRSWPMKHKGAAVLFSEMTPGADFEADFNAWYDEEHIPLRTACPGFVSACRYKAAVTPNYLAVYELGHIDVLGSDPYRAIKDNPSERTAWMLAHVTGFTRYFGRETSCRVQDALATAPLEAPVLYAVFFNVPPDGAAEFDAWYEEEHVPILMDAPDWLMVRRFAVSDGVPQPYTRLALHYLADEAVLSSPQRVRARGTPWRLRLARKA